MIEPCIFFISMSSNNKKTNKQKEVFCPKTCVLKNKQLQLLMVQSARHAVGGRNNPSDTMFQLNAT